MGIIFSSFCVNVLVLLGWLFLIYNAGGRQEGSGGVDGLRSKTDKQLVHKPKETSLEAISSRSEHDAIWCHGQ